MDEACYADMMETLDNEVFRNVYKRTGEEIFLAYDNFDEIILSDKEGNTVTICFSIKQLDDTDIELLGLTPPDKCDAVQRVDISLILRDKNKRFINNFNWSLKPYNSSWSEATSDIVADLLLYTHPKFERPSSGLPLEQQFIKH